jgi:hypothetical protein
MMDVTSINGVGIECIYTAAAVYRVEPAIIASVLSVENGRVGTASKNKDGSYDLGVMQINTVWLDKLSQCGYSRHEIQYNACSNVWIGTWILSLKIHKNKNFWAGVGDYNSSHLPQNKAYQQKVAAAFYELAAYLSKPPKNI